MKINETPLPPISENVEPAGSATTAPSSDIKALANGQGNLNAAIDQAMGSFDHVLAAVKGPINSAENDKHNQSGWIENYSFPIGAENVAPGGSKQAAGTGKGHLGDLTFPAPRGSSNVQNFSFSVEQVIDVSNQPGGAGAGKVKLPDLSPESPSMADQDSKIPKPRSR